RLGEPVAFGIRAHDDTTGRGERHDRRVYALGALPEDELDARRGRHGSTRIRRSEVDTQGDSHPIQKNNPAARGGATWRISGLGRAGWRPDGRRASYPVRAKLARS